MLDTLMACQRISLYIDRNFFGSFGLRRGSLRGRYREVILRGLYACFCFRVKFSDFIGTKYAIATSSCTGAIYLSLLAGGISEGDEVIVPAKD